MQKVPVDDGSIRGFSKNTLAPSRLPAVESPVPAAPAAAPSFSFFVNAGGSTEWSNELFPYSQDASVGTSEQLLLLERKPKRDIDRISCYNCFKVVVLGMEKTLNVKNFCSFSCLDVYRGGNTVIHTLLLSNLHPPTYLPNTPSSSQNFTHPISFRSPVLAGDKTSEKKVSLLMDAGSVRKSALWI